MDTRSATVTRRDPSFWVAQICFRSSDRARSGFWAGCGRKVNANKPKSGPKLPGPEVRSTWNRILVRQLSGQNRHKTGPENPSHCGELGGREPPRIRREVWEVAARQGRRPFKGPCVKGPTTGSASAQHRVPHLLGGTPHMLCLECCRYVPDVTGLRNAQLSYARMGPIISGFANDDLP